MMYLIFVFDSEFVKQDFGIILCAKAGVHKITFYLRPIAQSIIVEHL